MRSAWVVALVVAGAASTVEGAELNVSVIAGGQVLERKDTSGSHGPLVDEVTLGRTFLGGASIGVGIGPKNQLSAELVIGPYRNDIDRACIAGEHSCTIHPSVATRRALHYGLQYSLLLSERRSGPFVGVGVGAKKYTYDESIGRYSQTTSVALHAATGYEFSGRITGRLEARGVLVPDNPYLEALAGVGGGGVAFELQLRASVRFALWK